MPISKKYKHGDWVIDVQFYKDTGEFDMGKVLSNSKMVSKRKKEQFKDAALNAIKRTLNFVICEWDNPKDITWIDEREIRLATDAEKILYGPKSR